MLKIIYRTIFCAVVCFAPIYSTPLSATPREVILYPDSAYVTEAAKIRLQPVNHDQKKAVFTLPAKADPASLIVGFEQPTKMRIDDLSRRRIMPDDDESLKSVRIRLKKAQDEKNELLAHIKSLEAQIQFWQAQAKSKAKNTAEAANTVNAIGRNLKTLYREKLSKEPDLEKADKRIADYAEEMDGMVNKKEAVWELTLLISGALTGETPLIYSYLITGCGWTPRYRIEGDTNAGQITFTQQVNIWQNSPVDWNRVTLRIASRKPVYAAGLPELRDRSTPEPNGPPREQKGTGKSKTLKDISKSFSDDKDPIIMSADGPNRTGVMSADLGIVDLPSRSTRTVTVKNDARSADFTYLLKPSLSRLSWIKASLRQPFTEAFPAAEALFLIDGVFVEKKTLTFPEQTVDLLFGIDPRVTVDRRLLKQLAGASSNDGSRGRQNIFLDIKNTKTAPVKILIEEALPQSTDGKTAAIDHFDPPPSEQDGINARWRFELSAGATKTISVLSPDK